MCADKSLAASRDSALGMRPAARVASCRGGTVEALVSRTDNTKTAPTRTRFTAMVVSGESGRRRSLARKLRLYGATTVFECSSHADALAKAQVDGTHDLCVVDGTSADGPILPLIAELRSLRWRRVVILTERDDAYAIRAALRAGVRGFVVMAHSGIRISARSFTRPVRRPGRAAPGELSSRELEVLQSVAEGHSNKVIGDELALSSLTVKSHLARIARKLDTGDRAAMVAVAIRSGLIR